MKKKETKKAGKAKGNRKQSTIKDLRAKNAEAVKGGATAPTEQVTLNYSKIKWEY